MYRSSDSCFAVLPAKLVPSLFGSQCRKAAICNFFPSLITKSLSVFQSSQLSWCPPFSGANAAKQLSATSNNLAYQSSLSSFQSSQQSWCPPFSGANAAKQLSATSNRLVYQSSLSSFCPPSGAGALPFREPMPQSSYLQLLTIFNSQVHYLLFCPFSRAGALPFREPMPQSNYHTWEYEKRRLLPPFQFICFVLDMLSLRDKSLAGAF